jgi:hypothetical protein
MGSHPVDEGLEDLFPRGPGLKLEIAAVLDLVNRILILKPAPLLLFQIQGE